MEIQIGYETGSGRSVSVPLRHMAVTGQTQESGKTTTLEALVHRSELRAVAFVTKRGEQSFRVARPIAPYFAERADWQFVAAILEATMRERMKFERSWIIEAARGARSLVQVQKNVRERMRKARGLNLSVLTTLDAYLDLVLPQIARLPYSSELALAPGLNVMDLGGYSMELQALVIRSVLEWVYKHERNVIVVIPEAWEFIPQARGSPVLLAAEELIRKGGALENFLWLDSQDLAGVHKNILRQVGVWVLGVQREAHEVKRALDHIPMGSPKPRASDVMTLGKGEFFVCYAKTLLRVYVQPAWMVDVHAQAIARGEEGVETAREIARNFDRKKKRQQVSGGAVVPAAPEGAPGITRVQDAGGPSTTLRAGFDLSGAGGPPPEGSGPQGGPSVEDQEEAMWKENYEELQSRYKRETQELHARLKELGLRLKLSVAPSPVPDPEVSEQGSPAAVDFDSIYRYVRQRVRQDPETLALLAEQPQLELKIERPRIEIDGNSVLGRIAQLLADGFFAEPRSVPAVQRELKRRGSNQPTTNLYRPLSKLASYGYLYEEAEGYRATKMKIQAQS